MSFEWRKDEEEGWEEQVPLSVVVERPSPPYRLYAAILAVMFVVGGIVYGQLRQRAEMATAGITADVAASVEVWQQAIVAQDAELFDSLLSRRNGRWAREQQDLLANEQFWGRQGWGWRWQETADSPPHITLSPDLTQAEVVLPQTYQVGSGLGVTRTVVLSQTAVFRKNGENWLLTAPSDAFWGEEQTAAGHYVRVTFPARDRAVVLELIKNLEAFLQQLCLRAEAQCQLDRQVELDFVTDPNSIYALPQPIASGDMGRIDLPAPTLFGVPKKEWNQSVWSYRYALRLVPSVLPLLFDWQGERPLFYEATVTHLLAEWGWQEPVLTPSHYELLLNPPASLQEISLAWASEDFAVLVEPGQVQALLAFLVARGETAVSLQHSLTNPNFWQWANLPANDPAMEQAWLQFLYDHSASASQAPPIPLPGLDVRLICGGDKVYRYDGLAWQDEIVPYEGQSFVEAVPHDNGLIVAGRYFEESAKDYRGRAFWVQGERSILFSEWRTNTDAPLVSAQHHDPTGRKLVLQENDPVDRKVVRYRLLDLDDCREDDCALALLPGWPVWSADGRSSLIMQTNLSNLVVPQQTQLWRGDADGQIVAELGQGYAPFWLDNGRYGYVRLGSNGRSEVVTANISDDNPEVLLTSDELLLRQISGPGNPPPTFIANVQVNPINAKDLYINIMDAGSNTKISFRVEQASEQLYKVEGGWSRPGFGTYSPDGRSIILSQGQLDNNVSRFVVTRLEDRFTNEFIIPNVSQAVSHDWTSDSQWLLINYPGFLKLIAPGHHYQTVITHAFGTCERVAWVQ